MMKTVLMMIFAVSLTGCMTTAEPVVEPTKQWENHYYTVEEFQNGTKEIKLEKGESVWVISNRTLSRVLKNYMNKNEK